MKPTSKRLLAGLALILGGTAVYRFYPWTAPVSVKSARPPAPVIVARAVTQDVPLLLDAVGRAVAQDSVTLKSRVDGQVLALPFSEGQPVVAGAVLAQLDPADFTARLRLAEANLARDQTQLDKAKADVERYRSLKNRSFVSEQQLADAQSTAAQSTAEALAATVRADEAAVESARLQRNYTTIRAPFAGIIGAKLVSPGATVKANETALAVLNQVQPLEVSFTVPERYLPRLQAGLQRGPVPVTVRVPGTTEFGRPDHRRD